jgi:hypothetical protein
VTGNLPVRSWTGIFGSKRLTVALLDRSIHRVPLPETNGVSYRKCESKRRPQHRRSGSEKAEQVTAEEPGTGDVSED